MIEYNFSLEGISPLAFYGVNNSRFNQLKEFFPQVVFVARGEDLKLRGPEESLARAKATLEDVAREIHRRGSISEDRFHDLVHLKGQEKRPTEEAGKMEKENVILYGSRGSVIQARTAGQVEIVKACEKNDIVFAIGPAGTGKTYTAVALAVKALKEKRVRKIVLCRPAVEAGESLGFLPGDLKDKVDPYLRPLYDALDEMLHSEKLKSYLEKNIIEIVPLAYMRGRTLNSAFVILDEAQNATEIQFKMFLTRMGKDSKIIVTGDQTQVDLPRNQRSGLHHSLRILDGIPGISFVRLTAKDVVRHRLVKKIIAAYEVSDQQRKKEREEKDAGKATNRGKKGE